MAGVGEVVGRLTSKTAEAPDYCTGDDGARFTWSRKGKGYQSKGLVFEIGVKPSYLLQVQRSSQQ